MIDLAGCLAEEAGHAFLFYKEALVLEFNLNLLHVTHVAATPLKTPPCHTPAALLLYK